MAIETQHELFLTNLERELAADPTLDPVRFKLALALNVTGRHEAALAQVKVLLENTPFKLAYLNLKAAILARLTQYDAAIATYETILGQAPNLARTWMRYGNVLRTVGRGGECIRAYKECIALEPMIGEAWWCLANLKTFPFDDASIASMSQTLDEKELRDEDRIHLHFALGKALEDHRQYEKAFNHYACGNAARRSQVRWNDDAHRAHVLACKRVQTRSFFSDRLGAGDGSADPIFIVGLPRAGSTLVEQILASHSQVEGTMELEDVTTMARELAAGVEGTDPARYLDALASLPMRELTRLGEAYLDRTRIHRKTRRPFFIDKMPNNYNFVGMIQLMLPNSKIIDARRHPVANCLSLWKQLFTQGQSFSYDLRDLGRHYREYDELMAHYDDVLPGRVLRLHYEDLVADFDRQVRRLLDHCGLAFEPACLRFFENPRPVRTASSEQVRRPLYNDAVDHWRAFEPWLGELKLALGPCLQPGQTGVGLGPEGFSSAS